MSKQLVSLQGYLFLAERTPQGRPDTLFWSGNLDAAQLEMSTEKATKNESFSGGRGLYGSRNTGRSARLTGTFDEWLTKVLALGFQASPLDVAAGSVTGEPLPTGLAVGDFFALDHPYASDLVITDSAGTPASVPLSHFRKAGHNERTWEVIEPLTTFSQPLSAAYGYEVHEDLEAFTEEPREIYGLFDGINTETDEPWSFDIYKMKFDPFANLGLIHAEYGSLPFGADILVDPQNFNANGRGGYYKLRRKKAT